MTMSMSRNHELGIFMSLSMSPSFQRRGAILWCVGVLYYNCSASYTHRVILPNLRLRPGRPTHLGQAIPLHFFVIQPFSVIRDSPSCKSRSPRQFESPTRQFESVATPPTTSVPRSSNVVGKHGAQGCWLHPLQKPECVVSRLHAGIPCS